MKKRLENAGYYNIKGQFGSFKMKGGDTIDYNNNTDCELLCDKLSTKNSITRTLTGKTSRICKYKNINMSCKKYRNEYHNIYIKNYLDKLNYKIRISR